MEGKIYMCSVVFLCWKIRMNEQGFLNRYILHETQPVQMILTFGKKDAPCFRNFIIHLAQKKYFTEKQKHHIFDMVIKKEKYLGLTLHDISKDERFEN